MTWWQFWNVLNPAALNRIYWSFWFCYHPGISFSPDLKDLQIMLSLPFQSEQQLYDWQLIPFKLFPKVQMNPLLKHGTWSSSALGHVHVLRHCIGSLDTCPDTSDRVLRTGSGSWPSDSTTDNSTNTGQLQMLLTLRHRCTASGNRWLAPTITISNHKNKGVYMIVIKKSSTKCKGFICI